MVVPLSLSFPFFPTNSCASILHLGLSSSEDESGDDDCEDSEEEPLVAGAPPPPPKKKKKTKKSTFLYLYITHALTRTNVNPS